MTMVSMSAEAGSSESSKRQAEPADAAARPRLVLFYSPTSGHCRRVEASLAQILQRRKNRSTFALVRVNVEERPDLAERFRIDVVPTLLVIEGHRVARRIVSPDTARDLARALDPWLQ